jgi:CubicO group peptidase (beta-lactamase class C family)
VADGPSYAETYACGDATVSLADWLEGYVAPGGPYWSQENFLETGPGDVRSYSNVGFGLLGLAVENVSGRPFDDYTRDEIFLPLGMDRTAWSLSRAAVPEHAVPYLWLGPEEELEVEDRRLLPEGEIPKESFVPYCLYSFYNYPDGLVRTSVRQLARFVMAHLAGGELDGARILEADTVDEIFSRQIEEGRWEEGRSQGLTWRATPSETLGLVWGHGGADPGIRAQVLYRPQDEVTVILLANRMAVPEIGPILLRMFEEGARMAADAPVVD